ncbi:unnamed protein product [Amoebophrya sp. A120]|nr:unnamed protein product [Amoebophrya sp. A120]|eukprot:GSA120T00008609001.1
MPGSTGPAAAHSEEEFTSPGRPVDATTTTYGTYKTEYDHRPVSSKDEKQLLQQQHSALISQLGPTAQIMLSPKGVANCSTASTREMMVLWILVGSSLFLCIVEVWVSILAHSVALRADGFSVGADTAGYAVNLILEYAKRNTVSSNSRQFYDLLGAILSLGLLFFCTVSIASQSISRIENAGRHHIHYYQHRLYRTRLWMHKDHELAGLAQDNEGSYNHSQQQESTPNFKPVFFVAVLAMLTDIGQIISIRLLLKRNYTSTSATSNGPNANVDAALIHFWADVMRGVCVFVMSLTMWLIHIGPQTAQLIDGLVSLFISFLLACILFGMLVKVYRDHKRRWDKS